MLNVWLLNCFLIYELETFVTQFYSIESHKTKHDNLLKENWKFKLKKCLKQKNGRLIMQSKCTECGIKKLRFLKEQKAKRLFK